MAPRGPTKTNLRHRFSQNSSTMCQTLPETWDVESSIFETRPSSNRDTAAETRALCVDCVEVA